MLDVNFYGVNTITKEKALIKLLEKTIEIKKRSLVFSDSIDELKKLDNILWTSANWLPHALVSDPYKEQQLILLTNDLHNLYNDPEYIFIIDSSKITTINNIKRVSIIFYNNLEEEKKIAREQWKWFKDNNYNIKYFQQNKEGKFDSVQM